MKITIALTKHDDMDKFDLNECLDETFSVIQGRIYGTRTKTHHQGKVYAYVGDDRDKEITIGSWNVDM